MSALTRKNLVVDDAKLKSLARRRGKSESATVRELVDFALLADEVEEIFLELQKRGGLDDAFGRLSGPDKRGRQAAQRQAPRASASA